jgi:phospholipid transport system substrate-binding protein
MPRRFSFILLTVIGLAMLSPAVAAAQQSPKDFVSAQRQSLMTLLSKGKSAANDRQIQTVVDGMLDYDLLANEAMASIRDKLNEAQQAEFRSLLKKLVRQAYRKDLDKTANYSVDVLGATKLAGHKYKVVSDAPRLVDTVAKHKQNKREDPIRIGYVLRKRGAGWIVFDILTEGSSLVLNYRSQFQRVVKKHGAAELLKRMRSKAK